MTTSTRRFVRLLVALQLLLVALAVSGAVGYVLRLRSEVLGQHLLTAEAQARALEDHLTQSLTLADVTLAALEGFVAQSAGYPGALNRMLDDSQRRLPQLRSLSLATPDGRVFASSTAENLGVSVDPQAFESVDVAGESLRLGSVWAGRDLYEGRRLAPGVPAGALTFLPVMRVLDTVQGPVLAIASLNPDYFVNHASRLLASGLGAVDVLGYAGEALWSSRAEQPPGAQVYPGDVLASMREREIGAFDALRLDERPVLMAFRASPIFPLFVGVRVDRQAALARWEREATDTLLVTGLVLLALVSFTGFLAWRIVLSLGKEERLLDERRLASRVFEHSTDGILVTDARQRIIALNPALERSFGYRAAELLGQTPRIFSSGLHDRVFYERLWQALLGDGLWQGEIVNRRKDGQLVNEWLTISTVNDAAGNRVNYVAVFRDVTEQFQQARRLERQLEALRALNDIVAVTGLDPLATLRQALAVASRHLGMEFGVVGRIEDGCEDLVVVAQVAPPGTLEEGQRFALGATLCQETLVRDEVLAVDLEAEPAYRDRACCQALGLAYYVGVPVRTDGRVFGTLSLASRQGGIVLEAHDLEFVRMLARWAGAFLERAAAEAALREAKSAAEAASIAKSRFLATMSHELRTPMNGVLGMAQLLMMDPVSDAERLDYARTIYHSGETLLALLNDILDLSKVEAGKLELAPVVVNGVDMVREGVSLFLAAAQRKGLALHGEWQAGPGNLYWGDEIRLRQMLSNLVSNAIKFTESGEVAILGRETRRDEAGAWLRFEVRDTGIGISAEQQALLFKPFSQVDASDSRRFSGSGLGLSIVARLAELMGGSAGVWSTPGEGSLFWFEVCLKPLAGTGGDPTVPAPVTPVAPQGAPVRPILLAEDNPGNRNVVTTLLCRRGLAVETVEDGAQALAYIQRGGRPAVILMDCQMPGMDGFEATRAIRQWEDRHGMPRVPVIAMTARVFESDRQLCVEAGMDDFVAKPVDFQLLLDALQRHLGPEEEREAPPAEPAADALPAGAEPLLVELDILLRRNRYAAVDKFVALEGLVGEGPRQLQLRAIRALAEEFRFAEARQRLLDLRGRPGWEPSRPRH